MLFKAQTCNPTANNVLSVSSVKMPYPTWKSVIQRENVLFNTKTSYLMHENVIQWEKGFSNVNNVLSKAKTYYEMRKTCYPT